MASRSWEAFEITERGFASLCKIQCTQSVRLEGKQRARMKLHNPCEGSRAHRWTHRWREEGGGRNPAGRNQEAFVEEMAFVPSETRDE